MNYPVSPSLSKTLLEAQAGNSAARERLAQWMIEQVQNKVQSVLGRKAAGSSQSSLTSKVLLKIVQGESIKRAPHVFYLYSVIARATREILIECWRRRSREARQLEGGVPLGDRRFRQFDDVDWDFLEMEEAINALDRIDPRKATVVTMRFFWGMSVEEVADQLGISISTVESDWRLARAWLFERLKRKSDD